MIDRDEIVQAVENALGGTISCEVSATRRTVDERLIERRVRFLADLLEELPGEMTVAEMREALTDD